MHSPDPSVPEPEASRLMRLAGGAAQLLIMLRALRRARDEGTISADQYEAELEAIELESDQPSDAY